MQYLKTQANDLGLLCLRLLIGFMMIFPHGWSKAASFGERLSTFPDPLGIGSALSLSGAVFTEVICSLMLILGIKTRWFSAPLLFTMLVAVFLVHANDPWKVQEKAALYGVVYLVLMITGGGRFSVRD